MIPSLFASGSEADPWRTIRQRRRELVRLMAIGVLVLSFLGFILTELGLKFLAQACGIAWIILIGVASVRLSLSKCPECGELFYQRSWLVRGNPFRTTCVHCGAVLNEEPPNNSLQRTRYRRLRDTKAGSGARHEPIHNELKERRSR
jgi:hypothetical protein